MNKKSTHIFIECGYFFYGINGYGINGYGINGMSDIIVIYVLSESSLNE